MQSPLLQPSLEKRGGGGGGGSADGEGLYHVALRSGQTLVAQRSLALGGDSALTYFPGQEISSNVGQQIIVVNALKAQFAEKHSTKETDGSDYDEFEDKDQDGRRRHHLPTVLKRC